MMKRPRIFIAWAIPVVFSFTLGIGVTQFSTDAWADGNDIRRMMDPWSGDPTEPGTGYELPPDAPSLSVPVQGDQDPIALDRSLRLPLWLVRILQSFAFGL